MSLCHSSCLQDSRHQHPGVQARGKSFGKGDRKYGDKDDRKFGGKGDRKFGGKFDKGDRRGSRDDKRFDRKGGSKFGKKNFSKDFNYDE